MSQLESYLLPILRGEKKAPFLRPLLRLLSYGYLAGLTTRHLIYDRSRRPTKLPVYVISVGNIVTGGTGKTPVVEYLAKALTDRKVAILSRGYRRKSTVPMRVTKETCPLECGDEPYLLAKRVPSAAVYVDKNRASSGSKAIQDGADLLLLDDGMQHRKLHRDLEIVVMDATDLFGGGHYLPAGFLRDTPTRLKTADHILLTGVADRAHYDTLCQELTPYTTAPVTAMQHYVENSHELTSKKVAAFSAIANPSKFTRTLKTLGCEIVQTMEKPDHMPFYPEELQRLKNQASSASLLVCTEKDAVKLPKNLHLPIKPVKISLRPTHGKEHLEQTLRKVHNV